MHTENFRVPTPTVLKNLFILVVFDRVFYICIVIFIYIYIYTKIIHILQIRKCINFDVFSYLL